MKEILISIQPQWVEKILNGEKTIEIRKTMPKCELPCKVYIYCTKAKNAKENIWKVIDPLNQVKSFYTFDKFGSHKDVVLNGKVVAEFTLNKIEIIPTVKEKRNGASYQYHVISEDILNKSCLKQEEILEYTNGKDLYAWHIDDLKIYDTPKELSEFSTSSYCSNYMKNVDVTINALGDYVAHYEDNFFCKKCKYFDGDFNICERKIKMLTRPPQSWCYVEELFLGEKN